MTPTIPIFLTTFADGSKKSVLVKLVVFLGKSEQLSHEREE